MRHRDDLPLQPLGGVHGEDLDAVVGYRDLGWGQAVFDLGGGVQIGKQTPITVGGGPPGVVGHDVGECVEVFGAGPTRERNRLRCSTFDIDTERPPDLSDQVWQWVRQPSPQRGQLAASCDDPAVAHRRVAVGRSRIADRVGQAGRVGVAAPPAPTIVGRPTRSAPADRPKSTARRHSAAMSAAPSRQRGPVSTRNAATPAVGSAASRNIATTSATSGMCQQSAKPDHLDRARRGR